MSIIKTCILGERSAMQGAIQRSASSLRNVYEYLVILKHIFSYVGV